MAIDNPGAFLNISVAGRIATRLDTDKPMIPVIGGEGTAWLVTVCHQECRVVLDAFQNISKDTELLILPVIVV